MSLSWKDPVATVFVAGAAALAVAKVNGFSVPLLSNWRLASVLVLAVGFGACIVIGSGTTPVKNTWTTTAAVLGVLAVILAIIGIIFNSQLAFIMLTTDIVVLWFLTTARHVLANQHS